MEGERRGEENGMERRGGKGRGRRGGGEGRRGEGEERERRGEDMLLVRYIYIHA